MIEATILTWLMALGAGCAAWLAGADTYLALRGRGDWHKVALDLALTVFLTAATIALIVTA